MTMARTYPSGVTSWVDTEQPDIVAAQHFYGELFGWTFTTVTPAQAPVPYVVAQLGGQDVAGLGVTSAGATPAADPVAWNTYMAVDYADLAADRVTRAGGRVLSPAADAGEGGRAATVADPSGVTFRLWQARRRLGAQVTNAPGAWNFSDLHAEDPEQAFYTDVFGWSFDDVGFGTMIRVPGYGEHLASTVDPGILERQSAVSAPPGFADAIGWVAPLEPGMSAHWHVTFTVANRDQTAERAERLGAHVLTTDDSAWTRTAYIRDPQGARFTASQFTPRG